MTEKPTDSESKTVSLGTGETVALPRTGVFETSEKPGDTIGSFKLLSVLGEGGFGIVWLAERREPIVQRVAVKVIKPGMDSREVVARFEQERQALAVMNHPSIAKVLDAGATANGRPYFVMEYVKGDPITVFCDKNRLTLRQRLELFLPVLDAVQHAHSKGIIHRDLKPSNVLVAAPDGQSGIGQPKVIDFGIAKAISQVLTDKTLFTQQGQIVGTPEYMSPEQANLTGIDVDTRTDVYSLGVVLYELLTGVLPFDPRDLRSKGYDEIRRIIREVDPPNPSTRLGTMMSSGNADQARTVAERRGIRVAELERALRSELEWIPLKAMRKERERRYSTPSEMAQDIRNYLGDRPLIAGPESRRYRARKFVSKHRMGVGVSALIAATLLGATFVSVRFGLAEKRARLEAQAQREIAEEVNGFLNDDLLLSADPEQGGIDTKVVDLLDPAADALPGRFTGKPRTQSRLCRTLGEAYLALGIPEKAEPLLQRALALSAGEDDRAFRSAVSAKLAEATYRLQSGESAQSAVDLARTRLAEAEKEFGPKARETMNLRNQLGGALKWRGDLEESRLVYEQTLADRRAVLGEKDVDTLITRHNLNTLALREARRLRATDPDAAKRGLEKALEDRRAITRDTQAALGNDHPQTLASWAEECGLLSESGRVEEAIAMYPGAIEAMNRRLGFAHWRTIETTARYGAALKRAGRVDDAIDQLTIGVEGTRAVRGVAYPDTFAITDFLVICLEETNRFDRAAQLLERSYADCLGPPQLDEAKSRAEKMAEFCERRGDTDGAAKWRKLAA
ncbi:MAG: protein kinase [Phycisphaeraceae bacterium]|nr:protein kinase [Phycisphaeraceae bacterium]